MYLLLRLTLAPYLKIRYRISGRNTELFKTLKPPFLLLPNHVTHFDPVMVNAFVPHRVHFVMSDGNLRSPLLRWYYGLAGVVAKTKAIPDSYTVKDLVRLAQAGKVICIFPEGRASWDGRTHDVFVATAKLARLLRIPVVVPRIEGGYLSRPRWSPHVRPGGMTITYNQVLTPRELKELPVAEIHRRIVDAMDHDEFASLPSAKYRTGRGAEFLEAVLFLCPSCGGRQTLFSSGNDFICRKCGAGTRWTDRGSLISSEQMPHESVGHWFDWQFEALREKLKTEDFSLKPIFCDESVELFLGCRMDPLKRLFNGTFRMYSDRIEAVPETPGEKIVFPLEQIDGIQVLRANQLEFYREDDLYVVKFSHPRISGYKYLCAAQILVPERAELL